MKEKDLEWDHLMGVWENWFSHIGIKKYTLVKRASITKELEQIKEAIAMTSTSDGPRQALASMVVDVRKEEQTISRKPAMMDIL